MKLEYGCQADQVIDYELGLKLSQNDPKLALDLLKILVDELPEMKTQILTACTKNDFESTYNIVHKLHGGTCYCGVPPLKSAARALEIALTTNKAAPKNLDLLVKALCLEIDRVLTAYEQLS